MGRLARPLRPKGFGALPANVMQGPRQPAHFGYERKILSNRGGRRCRPIVDLAERPARLTHLLSAAPEPEPAGAEGEEGGAAGCLPASCALGRARGSRNCKQPAAPAMRRLSPLRARLQDGVDGLQERILASARQRVETRKAAEEATARDRVVVRWRLEAEELVGGHLEGACQGDDRVGADSDLPDLVGGDEVLADPHALRELRLRETALLAVASDTCTKLLEQLVDVLGTLPARGFARHARKRRPGSEKPAEEGS